MGMSLVSCFFLRHSVHNVCIITVSVVNSLKNQRSGLEVLKNPVTNCQVVCTN